MTMILASMLALDVILHGLIVMRFGVKGNEPPLVFGLVYAALTVAVALSAPYALWATLVVSLVGIAGLAAAFRTIPHEKNLERVILVLGVAIILLTGYMLTLS